MSSVGESDTLRQLGHPFYDRDSEAAPWRGPLPPYDAALNAELTDAETCNCESSFCEHERGCANRPEGHWTMDYVGPICDVCASVAVANGGGGYIHPIHTGGASC